MRHLIFLCSVHRKKCTASNISGILFLRYANYRGVSDNGITYTHNHGVTNKKKSFLYSIYNNAMWLITLYILSDTLILALANILELMEDHEIALIII